MGLVVVPVVAWVTELVPVQVRVMVWGMEMEQVRAPVLAPVGEG